jgi:hypothetical protein
VAGTYVQYQSESGKASSGGGSDGRTDSLASTNPAQSHTGGGGGGAGWSGSYTNTVSGESGGSGIVLIV